jgi:hypothetical protein
MQQPRVHTLGDQAGRGTPVGPFTREDAVLLAASSDLLAALEAMVEWAHWIEDEDSRHPIQDLLAAYAAIAKAKG